MKDERNSENVKLQCRSSVTTTSPTNGGLRKVTKDAPTLPGEIARTAVSIALARSQRRRNVHVRRVLALLKELCERGLRSDSPRWQTPLPAGCVLAVRYQSR